MQAQAASVNNNNNRRAYDFLTETVSARSIYKRSVKLHIRSLKSFQRATIKVGKARHFARTQGGGPNLMAILRDAEVRETEAIAEMTQTVQTMNNAHEALVDAERDWTRFRSGFPPDHVFLFPDDA